MSVAVAGVSSAALLVAIEWTLAHPPSPAQLTIVASLAAIGTVLGRRDRRRWRAKR